MKQLKLKLETKIMRRNPLVFMILLLLFASNISESQTMNTPSEKSETTFNTLLGQTLTSINSQKTLEGLTANINKLKRLSNLYPNEWLSDYYIALLDIKVCFATADIDKKNTLLKDAKEKIEILKKKKNANESEVITLDGYYYYAKIAMNPQKNGQLFYQDAIGNFLKAKAIDKNNPRPVLLLSIFQHNMSKFVGGNENDFCSKLNQIELMFKKIIIKDKLQPKWGENELKKYQEKEHCIQKKIHD